MKKLNTVLSFAFGFFCGRLLFVLLHGTSLTSLYICIGVLFTVVLIMTIRSFLLYKKLEKKPFPYFAFCFILQLAYLFSAYFFFGRESSWLSSAPSIMMLLVYFWQLTVEGQLANLLNKEKHERLYFNLQQQGSNDR